MSKKTVLTTVIGIICLVGIGIFFICFYNFSTSLTFEKNSNTVLRTFRENINIGILIQDAKTGKVLFKKNADRYFTPASNEKLFTAFAALHSLGPSFTYQTRLFVDTTKLHQGILQDSIYLQFNGDPEFTFAQLDRLIGTLSHAGIREITGNIVIDDSAFDQVTMSLGTTWDDQSFCWGAPLSAIIIDKNCVKATVLPAKNAGQPAELLLPTQPQSMQFVNQVITKVTNASECTIAVTATTPGFYTISGCIKMDEPPKIIQMASADPRTNLQIALTFLLKKNQIISKKPLLFKKINPSVPLLAVESSPSLQTLVTTMLKESDNIIANALFKTIGAYSYHAVGSFENGSQAIRDMLLQTTGLAIAKTTLIDGDGSSRYNFVTPQQIVTLLQHVDTFSQAAIFKAALPISGIDGTLKDRLNNPDFIGKVHAKTGTETAVTALSGYLETRKHRKLIFSIMINGFVDLPDHYKELEDQLCAAMINEDYFL